MLFEQEDEEESQFQNPINSSIATYTPTGDDIPVEMVGHTTTQLASCYRKH